VLVQNQSSTRSQEFGFSFPVDWPLAPICHFHSDLVPADFFARRASFFPLEQEWRCPCCGLLVGWALRGKKDAPYPEYRFDPETTLEFLEIISLLASEAHR